MSCTYASCAYCGTSAFKHDECKNCGAPQVEEQLKAMHVVPEVYAILLEKSFSDRKFQTPISNDIGQVLYYQGPNAPIPIYVRKHTK